MRHHVLLRTLLPANRRGQRGQTAVIVGFIIIFMVLLLGLVIDSVRLYILAAQAERAAESGALAGALYMPDFFDSTANPPSPDGLNAVKRVCAAVKQNGVTTCQMAQGTPGAWASKVPTNKYEIQVTVTLQADVFFLAYVAPNLSTATVSRTAAAQYLPPIQLGSRTYAFGDQVDTDAAANLPQHFWARFNGPYGLKENGDAYSPKWEEGPGDARTTTDGGSFPIDRWPLSSGVTTNHPQWGPPGSYKPNSDLQPSSFTGDQGLTGYNYEIVVPQGNTTPLEVQIYNPAFDPPTNLDPTTPESLGSACSDPLYITGGGCQTDQAGEYLQVDYALYYAPLSFKRSADTKLTTFYPPSLDLYPGDLTKHGCSGQAFDPEAIIKGTPLCVPLPSYINKWYPLPIANTTAPYTFKQPGIYRLALEVTGKYGFHQYAVKVTDALGQPPPTGVRLWAWNDMCVYFNQGGATATYDLGEIPASYAGKTLTFSLFDPGDGQGNVYLELLDPSGTPVKFPAWVRTVAGSGGTEIAASLNSDVIYNGLWLYLPVPIPANYNPTAGNDWWQLKYISPGGSTPDDTVTASVSLSGSPIHLVQLLN